MTDPARTTSQGRRPSTYEEALAQVADDLRLETDALRSWFERWLASRWPHENVPREWQGPCYAVYRLTKLLSALRAFRGSREGWRSRAIALGSPPHLRTEPSDRAGGRLYSIHVDLTGSSAWPEATEARVLLDGSRHGPEELRALCATHYGVALTQVGEAKPTTGAAYRSPQFTARAG